MEDRRWVKTKSNILEIGFGRWKLGQNKSPIRTSNFDLPAPSFELPATRRPQRLNVDQWSPSVFVAELFSFSAGLSSDLADVAFWSLFCP